MEDVSHCPMIKQRVRLNLAGFAILEIVILLIASLYGVK